MSTLLELIAILALIAGVCIIAWISLSTGYSRWRERRRRESIRRYLRSKLP